MNGAANSLKEIGERIRGQRDDMSVESLAALAGVPAEEINALERGEADFSYSVLHNIARVLRIDIAELINDKTPHNLICSHIIPSQRMLISSAGSCSYSLLAHTFKNRKADPVMVRLELSDGTPELHTHVGQEFHYILSGNVRYQVGDITHNASAGDSFYFDSSLPHSEQAVGGAAEFLAVVID